MFLQTHRFLFPTIFVTASLVIPNDQTTPKYVFAIYHNTVFQREVAGVWVLSFLFEKGACNFDRKLYEKVCFRARQTSSAIKMYVFLPEFWVLFVGSGSEDPFVHMFQILYYSVLMIFS